MERLGLVRSLMLLLVMLPVLLLLKMNLVVFETLRMMFLMMRLMSHHPQPEAVGVTPAKWHTCDRQWLLTLSCENAGGFPQCL